MTNRSAQSIGYPALMLLRLVLALAMIVFTILIFAQVVTRYVFDLGLFGLDDITALLAVWMYFLGAGYAAYAGEHISASLVDSISALSPKAQRAISMGANIATCLVMAVFVYWSAEYVLWTYQRNAVSAELKIPRFLFALPITVGCLLMSGFFFMAALRDFRALRQGR